MTEEVSESTKLSALLVFMSGFLTVILCVFILVNGVLISFSDSMGQKFTSTSQTAIYELAGKEFVTGPECYVTLSNNLEIVSNITVKLADNSTISIYEHDGKTAITDNRNRLFTSFSSKKFVVGIGTPTANRKDVPHLNIILVEVE